MLVKDCMTRHPIVISPDMPATEAQKIMIDNHVRHLPVVGDGKRLVGLITRHSLALQPERLGSLNVWEISRLLSNLKAKQVMIKKEDVFTIDADKTAERAARTMAENKIGCLPVLEEDIVIGILSETDLMYAMQEMMGLPQTGVRVTVRMPDQPGEGAKLMRTIAEQNWGIVGIGIYPARRREGMYDTVIKLPGVTMDEVKAVLDQISEQEIVDIRDYV